MNEALELEPRYTVTSAADQLGLHPQTLRLYERAGLLAPRRSGAGVRLYCEADLARVRRIQSYTAMGVNLAGVDVIFRLLERIDALERRLEAIARADAAEAEREQTELLRRRLRRTGSLE